jgi:hypothetical protein
MSVGRASAWLRAWDSQGIHRTATLGDAAGADWLAREAAALGAHVSIEEFGLDRLDPLECYLELDGGRIDGVPVFDSPSTEAAGVAGTLGPVAGDAAIGIAELSPQSVYTGDYRTLRQRATHRGLVVVCHGQHPGMALLNAEQFRQPYGVPAIHVSSEARDAILAAGSARLVAHSSRSVSYARNVVATIAGRDRTRPPLVVMTPRSSWWQSTSERGGGLVCWLESLRTVTASPPACDVVFTANSGHELGHLGLDDFMARRPGWDRPPVDGGATWIHYGANLGAVGGGLSVVSADDALRALAVEELTHAGQPPDAVAPKTLVPSGETRDIHRAGGRYLTLVGSNPLFHLPQDRWPHAVDAACVARIADAAVGVVARLATVIARE